MPSIFNFFLIISIHFLLFQYLIQPSSIKKTNINNYQIIFQFSATDFIIIIYFIYIKMKQLSIVSPDIIRNSPLNNSTAKRIHMFSKQERFKVPAPNCPVACYNLPSQLSKRKASFGYGIKSDFTKSSVLSPSCNAYEAKSIFEKGEKSNGKTFGISRELSPQFGIITQDILKFPGPGKYECKKDTLSTICYTMRPQTVDFIEKRRTNRYNPGPGQYQHLQAMPKDGKAFFQRFQTSKFAKINTGRRWNSKKDSPSPHTYDVKNNLSRDGKYVLSKNRGNGTRAFSQTMRHNFTEETAKLSITPGPGIYQSPTQFGIYGDSKFYKDKNNQTIS